MQEDLKGVSEIYPPLVLQYLPVVLLVHILIGFCFYGVGVLLVRAFMHPRPRVEPFNPKTIGVRCIPSPADYRYRRIEVSSNACVLAGALFWFILAYVVVLIAI